MPDLPVGFYSDEVYVFPVGPTSDGNFEYIPGPPAAESEDGRAKASLLASPAAGVLSVEAVWRAEPQALEAAESAIRARYPDVGSVGLRPVELSQTTASLTVAGSNGIAHTIGPNETSGMASQRVVFNDRLTSAEKRAAISAFQGQSGILTLTYEGTLAMRETSTVEISGDLAAEAKSLAPKKPEESLLGGIFGKKKDLNPPPPPDLAACAAAVDSAIASGRLKLTRVDTPNVSDATERKAESGVRNTVANMLLDKLKQMGADAVYLNSFAIRHRASEAEDVTFHISRSADLGDWLGRNGGGRLVSEVGAAIAEPER